MSAAEHSCGKFVFAKIVRTMSLCAALGTEAATNRSNGKMLNFITMMMMMENDWAVSKSKC
jgi:hypothetical protein